MSQPINQLSKRIRPLQQKKTNNPKTQKPKNSTTQQLKNPSTHQPINQLSKQIRPLQQKNQQPKNPKTQQLINSKTHQPINQLSKRIRPLQQKKPTTQKPKNSTTQQLINSKTHQPINPSTNFQRVTFLAEKVLIVEDQHQFKHLVMGLTMLFHLKDNEFCFAEHYECRSIIRIKSMGKQVVISYADFAKSLLAFECMDELEAGKYLLRNSFKICPDKVQFCLCLN